MSFLALILKNLLRQPVRSGLTMLGISIGITTVVALGVITESVKGSAGEVLRSGGSDFMIAQKGVSDLSFSTVSEDDWSAIQAQPGVEWATGVLFHIVRVESNPFFIMLGIRSTDLSARPPTIVAGSIFSDERADQAILGSRAATTLNVAVGDAVTVDNRPFTIVGIYQSGDAWQDGGMLAPLAIVQELANRPGYVTAVYVKVASDRDPTAVAQSIEVAFPQLTAVSQISEFGEVDQGLELIEAANLAISALAIGIGAIGVMNTMVMSVFERTREIGILRAVGWRAFRVFRMIVAESLILCALAAGIGSLLGVLATRAVLLIPAVETFVVPNYTADLFVRALVVAIIVALLGAIYPAFRAIRLTPLEALRHE